MRSVLTDYSRLDLNMFKALKNINRSENQGFSLVELLVVLLIMSVIAGIAVPLYLNQKQRSYLAVAQSDATSIGQEITSMVSDYTSFGSAVGQITLSSGVVTFAAMTAATGSGLAVATGPGSSGTLRVSTGSTMNAATTSSWATGTTNWCIEIVNNGTYAKYTNAGLTLSGIGTPTGSQLCVSGV